MLTQVFCKWQITVDEGKRIEFSFSRFDTQAKVDFVYLFDGTTASPSNMIAKFSGKNIPPSVTSRTNKVLVWFVTDQVHTNTGWELQYISK